MKGSAPLLAVIVGTWAVVWAVTQTLAATPLATGPTVLIGVGLTLLVVGGYPSAMRGPRRFGRLSATTIEDQPGSAALEVVSRTTPYLRDGLSQRTASRSARILLPLIGGSSVTITDTCNVLGFAGEGREPDRPADAARRSIELGRTVVESVEGGIEASSPLLVDRETVGSLLVRYPDGRRPSVSQLESVASLVSLHLELAEMSRRAQSAADARLEALRAQINPHFLFNTLNTIAAKSRTDPDGTRQLLQRLADFFRYSIQQEGQFAEFAHEYFFVRTYLSLEQARYEDRLNLHYDVDPQVLPARVPVLTIQPLVENAVKHGLAPKAGGGTVSLKARVDPLAGSIRIQVRDDGMGMEPDVLRQVVEGDATSSSGGVALRNIHERLEGLYGPRYRFDVRSSPGKGTRVELDLPL